MENQANTIDKFLQQNVFDKLYTDLKLLSNFSNTSFNSNLGTLISFLIATVLRLILISRHFDKTQVNTRAGSRTAATSKMELFVIIVNDWKPLTIITKRSILDVAAVLGPPLNTTIHSVKVI